MSDVVYLYAFVPADAPAPPPELRGLDDAPVALIPAARLAAVISRLPASVYAAEQVDRGLQDLGWLAERGVAHERVVAWYVDRGDVLPAGLLTLYSSQDSLLRSAHERADALVRQLERLRGAREWDLKVAVRYDELERHAGAVAPEVHSIDEEIAAAAPGRRFLLERKRADVVKRALAGAARNAARQLLERLRVHAREAVVLPVPPDQAELPVVLTAALLVERGAEAALAESFQRERPALEPLGFEAGLTGPWAPYRFLEETRARAD